MSGGGRSAPASLALGALLTCCAGLAWHRVFPMGALVPLVAVASSAPTLLVALGSGAFRRSGGSRPLSLWLALPGSVGAWLLAVGFTLMREGPAVSVPARTLVAVRDCWYDLLVAAPPAPAEPRLLVGVHALVWFAAYSTAEMIVRTRTALLPIVPAFVVLLAGVVLGVGGPGGTLPVVAAFLVLTLVLVLVRHVGEPGWRGVLGALGRSVPRIACLAGLAVLLGPAALLGRDRHPFDPRHLVHPAALPRTAVNPLDQVSSWLAEPDVAMFTVAAAMPENWRIAVLDRFDGRTWQTENPFRVTHARVPAAAGQVPRHSLEQVVTVGALSGPWLPAAASPVTVAGVDVFADPDTGVLLSRSPPRADLRYEVTSQVPRFTPDQFQQAMPDPSAQSHLDVPPGLPDVVREAAKTATAGASSPFEQASRLEKYLRSVATNDPTASPGHAYGHLAYFLAVSHRGTSEQFATAFAVMARSLGLPSRVVVGFRPGAEVRRGVWRVRGADALVWPEVGFAGLGWVPFFPTPSSTAAKGETSLADGQSQQRQELDQSLAAPRPVSARPQPAPATTATPTPASRGQRPRSWWLTGSVAGVVVGLGYLGLVVLVPSVRTRRRRRLADPAARVGAAWREALAVLRWIGVTNVAVLTTEEISACAVRRLGPPASAHLTPLARLVDEAAFSGRAPRRESGEEAWAHRDRLAALVRRSVGRKGTLRRRLSPRALRV